MKISIITAAYNAASTIEDTILSVLEQDYGDIEHIIVDGDSKDGTATILDKYRGQVAQVISEPDEGVYDAMNKGIALASGDVIGFLNADDIFKSAGAISRIARELADKAVDTVFGDIVIVDWDEPNRVHRYFRPKRFKPAHMRFGWMPPHPTFYVRRECFEQAGDFNTSFNISADFDLLLRILKVHGFSYSYIPETLVQMRHGGISSGGFSSTLTINREFVRACRMNGVYSNPMMVWSRYIVKIFELVAKPK